MADPSGRTEYLEATLGLVKRLEISKELIRECVTVPGCCCCMPLLHNHLMDSCGYVRKNTLLAAKGGCICTPLTPPKSATGFWWLINIFIHPKLPLDGRMYTLTLGSVLTTNVSQINLCQLLFRATLKVRLDSCLSLLLEWTTLTAPK